MDYKARIKTSAYAPDLLFTCIRSEFDRFPEKRLWCEVLFRAYRDVEQYLKDNSYCFFHDATSAQQWILNRSEDKFSFEWAVRASFSDDSLATQIINTVRKFTPTKLPHFNLNSQAKFKETISRTYVKRNRQAFRKKLEHKLLENCIDTERFITSILKITELEFFPPPTAPSTPHKEEPFTLSPSNSPSSPG